MFAGRPKPRALLRIADQAFERFGKCNRVTRWNQQARHIVLDQFRDCRNVGRNAGKPLALRLDQHVGEAVPIAVLHNLGGEHEQVGLTIGGEHFRLVMAPRHSIRCDRPRRSALDLSAAASAPPPI